MDYEQKEGDIAIYTNKSKKTERSPDWFGKCLINGEEKEISLWFKSETMMTGTIKEKFKPDFKSVQQEIASKETYRKENPSVPEEFSDEIPFSPVGMWA